jgi:hypothetical protein
VINFSSAWALALFKILILSASAKEKKATSRDPVSKPK